MRITCIKENYIWTNNWKIDKSVSHCQRDHHPVEEEKIINIRLYTSVTSECVRKKSKVVFYAKSLFSSEFSFSTTHSQFSRQNITEIFLSLILFVLLSLNHIYRERKTVTKEKENFLTRYILHVLLNLLL